MADHRKTDTTGDGTINEDVANPQRTGEPVEHPNPVTIVDQPVRDGLDNAVENSEVRTRDSE